MQLAVLKEHEFQYNEVERYKKLSEISADRVLVLERENDKLKKENSHLRMQVDNGTSDKIIQMNRQHKAEVEDIRESYKKEKMSLRGKCGSATKMKNEAEKDVIESLREIEELNKKIDELLKENRDLKSILNNVLDVSTVTKDMVSGMYDKIISSSIKEKSNSNLIDKLDKKDKDVLSNISEEHKVGFKRLSKEERITLVRVVIYFKSKKFTNKDIAVLIYGDKPSGQNQVSEIVNSEEYIRESSNYNGL